MKTALVLRGVCWELLEIGDLPILMYDSERGVL
jgi:hypothetical protein